MWYVGARFIEVYGRELPMLSGTVLMEFNEVPGGTHPSKDPISVLNFADMLLTKQKKELDKFLLGGSMLL